jgi:regulator of protease activity HflC (stomatin/prohibitin superfamily)
MVTGDLNAALVEWVVQYRISDPVKFLFEVREPSETLRYVSESVMREVVGDRTVDEVITIGRQEIESEALTKMQALSTKYAMGISIDQVQLKNINPPEPVQESFNEVNQAQQEKEKLINEARRDYNKVIPLAEGEKDQRIREADGYRLKRINEAEGDAARFTRAAGGVHARRRRSRGGASTSRPCRRLPGIRSKIIVDEPRAASCRCSNLEPPGRETAMNRLPLPPARSRIGLSRGDALYTVSEVEQVIITQFGKPVGAPVTTPGLKIKLPFIQTSTRSTSGCWSGTAVPRTCRPRTSSTSPSTFSPAGGSPIRCSTSCGCATSAARSRASTTSSAARRATPWPSTS